MGKENNKYYDGEITWFNVIEKYYWTLLLDDILIDNKSTNLCKFKNKNKKCYAVLDSGTTLMTTPVKSFENILNLLTGTNSR